LQKYTLEKAVSSTSSVEKYEYLHVEEKTRPLSPCTKISSNRPKN
jgi:hypothetical protein